jgi:phosphoserine phosphatase
MTLYIIRHGETDLNRQGIVQGSGVDADLNHIGRKQAKLFYKYYENVSFHTVITSNLRRTHQTVEPFLLRGLAHTKLPELNEICWGIHEGKKADEAMREEFNNLMSSWLSGNYDIKLQGGESLEELRARVSQAVHFFKKEEHKGKNILVCTHGRTLLCLVTVLLNKPLKLINEHQHRNTCLYKFHYIDDEFYMELENDLSHLGKMEVV